jgi:hypothetical protein
MFISIRPGPGHETIAQTIIDNRIHKLTRFYTDRIRSYDYEALTAQRREELIRADRREYTEKKLTIELSEDVVLNNAIKSLDAWDEAKKRHGDRSAKCFRLFNSRLKDGPKAYVRPELMQGHFRHAWLKLYMHYNKGANDAKTTADMLKIMLNITWDPTTLTPDEFVDYFDRMIAMYEAQGDNRVTPKDRNAYITAALRRGASQMYSDDLKYADFEDKPLSWLMERLARTNSRAHMERAVRSQHPRREYDLPLDNPEWVLNANYSQSKGVKRERSERSDQGYTEIAFPALSCVKCQKTGHDAADCWSEIVCGKCHRKGHPTNVCRATKDADGRPFKLPVRFDDKVQQK